MLDYLDKRWIRRLQGTRVEQEQGQIWGLLQIPQTQLLFKMHTSIAWGQEQLWLP